MLSTGEGTVKNPKLAAKYYQMAADAGNARAHWHLGLCYQNGIGVPKNMLTAQRMFLHAADDGFMEAEYAVGNFYYEGTCGFPDDEELGRKYLIRAAEKGHEQAREKLARLTI